MYIYIFLCLCVSHGIFDMALQKSKVKRQNPQTNIRTSFHRQKCQKKNCHLQFLGALSPPPPFDFFLKVCLLLWGTKDGTRICSFCFKTRIFFFITIKFIWSCPVLLRSLLQKEHIEVIAYQRFLIF